MKKIFMHRLKTGLAFTLIFLFSLPGQCQALAGLSEKYDTLHYNDYANLLWAHPGDMCEGQGSFCFQVEKKDGTQFKGLGCTLLEINKPPSSKIPYILARRSSDGLWLVYDLVSERFMIRDAPFDEAVKVWHSLDLPEPVLTEAVYASSYYRETVGSVVSDLVFFMLLMGGFLMVPAGVLFGLLGVSAFICRRIYLKTGQRIPRILVRVFGIFMGMLIVFYALWAVLFFAGDLF